MYFSSKKGKWYNWAVQTKPLYRYALTVTLFIFLLLGWKFGLYAYFDQAITTNQSTIAQMNQQLIQLGKAERLCNELSCKLPALQEKIACYSKKCCVPGFCQAQINTVIEKADQVGLHLTAYGKDAQENLEWCSCDNVQFSFTGSLNAIQSFFTSLKESQTMVACNSFSCEKTDEDQYNTHCKLSFYSVA